MVEREAEQNLRQVVPARRELVGDFARRRQFGLFDMVDGARGEQQARDLRRLLDRCRFLPLEEPSDHEAAAALYRSCRRQGTTIRRLPDWLIATVAMRINTTLLHTTPISRRSPATRP